MQARERKLKAKIELLGSLGCFFPLVSFLPWGTCTSNTPMPRMAFCLFSIRREPCLGHKGLGVQESQAQTLIKVLVLSTLQQPI